MTDQRFRSSSINEQLELFHSSGKAESNRFLKTLDRNGIPLTRLNTLIDFGCGVGRLTTNLSPDFKQVYGVDVSLGHLKVAEQTADQFGYTNIQWIHLQSIRELSKLPLVDAFLSVIVLQHNPPPVSQYILRTLLKHLNTGGIGFFQVPTHIENCRFEIKRYLSKSKKSSEMEMHPIPQANVFRICREEGVEVLEVLQDRWCNGLNAISNTFLVRKN